MTRPQLAGLVVKDQDGIDWTVQMLGPDDSPDAVMFDFRLHLESADGTVAEFDAGAFVGLFMAATPPPPPLPVLGNMAAEAQRRNHPTGLN